MDILCVLCVFFAPFAVQKSSTKEMVKACHAQHMKVVPWTVNDKEKIKSLISDGVDGIITDYPNYFAEVGK